MNKRILVISDMHLPYQHKDAIKFLAEIKKEFKPDRVINIGDLLDFHAISMHTHDPDLASAGHELTMARKYVRELESIYPQVTEVDSNHSSLVYRRAIKYGMSREFLKDYGDFLGTKKWNWVDDLTITMSNGQRCFFTHGRSADVLKVSQTMGMSAVQGHYHTKFLISYWANPDNLFFSMNVGCMINQKSMAFHYAKNFKTRFILGCGIILDGIPRLLPLVLNDKGDWIKKIV
ncbi:MAG: phosphoesterase [Marinovum sp.]|nr:phosphoesterase [Marinovum sp.]|tara:strand:+ start:1401 stop:2099 length:699 start_codon:yes stop_codon:yes gene_type:complete